MKGKAFKLLGMSEASPEEILKKVEDIVSAGKDLMSLRKPLEASGMFKKTDIDFTLSPVAHFRIKVGNKTLIIVNKKYADDSEKIVGELAFGFS